jgi:OOP family OmpA-OmpF porin
MKKILLLMIAAVIMLSLSFPQLSVSEIKEGSIEIAPFAGYYFLDHQKDKVGYGLRGGYNFTKNWGIEGAFDYAGSRAQFYHADLVYHLIPEKAFNPFIFAGTGVDHMKRSSDFHTRMLGEVGVGFKYFLTENIAIRADIRDIQDRYNHVATTLGMVFTFGGKTSKYVQTAAPEPKPEPKPELKPEPKVEEKVIILASEPKVEEKVVALASEPKVEEKVVILAFEDVHFDFDKATLTEEAQVILKRNMQILKDNPKAKVRIAGYTSASGTEEYNQRLSERRAKAVEEYLIKEGIVSPDRLSTIGYGKTRPAEYEAAPKDLYSKAAKANMRVLFEIIVK